MSENKKYYKEQSRLNWYTEDEKLSLEQINTGALLRIADATEKMASNYIALQNDRDYYKRRYQEEQASKERMSRRINALKGVITKMKKKSKHDL